MHLGLVVAGGRSRRFGAEKALAELQGRPLLDHALDRLAASCRQVGVNAPAGSEAAALAQARNLPLIADAPSAAAGPLAGVLAGLLWAQAQGAEGLITLPCDTPLLPTDLLARLKEVAAGRACAVARTPDGVQSLCAVWNLALLEDLRRALAKDHPPIHSFLEAHDCAFVDYPDASGFLNVNTPQDLAEAERRLSPT
jgi:molybdenum cofactor guanylyltransferase